MNILISRCSKRSVVVEELFQHWQLSFNSATVACDVGSVIAEAIDLSRLLQSSWLRILDRLFDGPDFNTEVIGRIFQEAVQRAIKVERRMLGCARKVRGCDSLSQIIDQLETEVLELERLDRTIASQWPFVDMAMVEQSRREFERGEYVSIEELLHAAQGHRPEVGQPQDRGVGFDAEHLGVATNLNL